MPRVEIRPVYRSNYMYDLIVDGLAVGVLWNRESCWYASASSMSDHSICEDSREAAAQRFLKQLSSPSRAYPNDDKIGPPRT